MLFTASGRANLCHSLRESVSRNSDPITTVIEHGKLLDIKKEKIFLVNFFM